MTRVFCGQSEVVPERDRTMSIDDDIQVGGYREAKKRTDAWESAMQLLRERLGGQEQATDLVLTAAQNLSRVEPVFCRGQCRSEGGGWCVACRLRDATARLAGPRLTEDEARAILRAEEVCMGEGIGPEGDAGKAWDAMIAEARERLKK